MKCARLVARFSAVASVVLGLACSMPAHAGTIEMVSVGNAGNANDPATGNTYGAVNYTYRIGKYDVTIGQYTDFLNAVDPSGTNPYGIYNSGMATDLNVAGIAFDGGQASGSKYSVIDNGGSSANRPITYVSWFDAARFANWMSNGQGSGSTENGAYTLNGAINGNAVARNAGFEYYIPTENEWYKSAYYSPALNSGAGGYFTYATQSNSTPGNVPGGQANQANYLADAGYSVTQTYDFSSTQNYLTDVGAFTNSASYYGTFDQSGNVFQWTDLDGLAGAVRSLRGGVWYYNNPNTLSSSFRYTEYAPSTEGGSFGFRLVAVPEIDPAGMSSVFSLVLGAFGILEHRRRKTPA